MNSLFVCLGPAVWRASWQGAVLAIAVFLLLSLLGERLAPRWRYLLWCVVMVRLLLLVTPASSWSAFNLVGSTTTQSETQLSERSNAPAIADTPRVPPTRTQVPAEPKSDAAPAEGSNPSIGETADSRAVLQPVAMAKTPVSSTRWSPLIVARILTTLWMTGCVFFGLRVFAASFALRRRLSACCRVVDPNLLDVLSATRQRFRLHRSPQLLVTPEAVSPYIVGAIAPKIIISETLVTGSSNAQLRHVLAHEMAHLVRGDLWANRLFLLVRVLHWFNPVARWSFRMLQAEREAACDEMALATLGEANRSEYAATIVELAANLSALPALATTIGFFSSQDRLKHRIDRLARPSSSFKIRPPVAAGLLLVIGLLGLTDSQSVVSAEQGAADKTNSQGEIKDLANPIEAGKSDYAIHGRCIDALDNSPLGGIRLRLFISVGLTSPPMPIGNAVSDADGRFEFTGLTAPRRDERLSYLAYTVAADDDQRPTAIAPDEPALRQIKNLLDIRMNRGQASLSGKVTNEQGAPVAGAMVAQYWDLKGRPFPDILSATTGADGRFTIDRLTAKAAGAAPRNISFRVFHPDYPETTTQVGKLPTEVEVKLQHGCTLTGTILDEVTGKPAISPVATIQRLDTWGEFFAACDATGHFRIAVPEGRYNILVAAENRVCVALTDRECQAGQTVELPRFTLINGGFISGRVINSKTGESETVGEDRAPIAIGLIGPSQPLGGAISPTRLAMVDGTGYFTLRTAPGENFPYFVNIRGDRMAWNTQQQPAIIVKEGETANYDMLITPEVSPAEKLKAAQKLVADLPKAPKARTERILAEFRKLSHTVDECELWCTLMQELVAIGPEAVPQICEELDHTTVDRAIRRLAFALRAIGDPRAVPALVRAIPRTLCPSSSDYGLIVNDFGLTQFMQKNDMSTGSKKRLGGNYFDLGRPPRELFATLHKLTNQKFDEDDISGISLTDDPRRQVLQRRLYLRTAQRWQTWWEANWRNLTADGAYRTVGLKNEDESLPAASKTLSPTARLGDGVQGETLSPAAQTGNFATYFLDLDTGYAPKWPAQFPRDEAKIDPQQLAVWAAQNGVDLMCTTHVAADGTQTFVLKALGMQVWEISERDRRNLDRLIAAGTLPHGRAVDELLMHYDADAKQYVPNSNAAFIYITREGSMGMIETTDRISRTADLTGQFTTSEATGVGFFKGVKFNLKSIVP